MLQQVLGEKLTLKDFLRIKDAARMLGVHPDTLRRWERNKKVAVLRHPVNRYRLYRRFDLEKLLEGIQPR